MTRTFCDRCKKETTNDLIVNHIHIFECDSKEGINVDICDDCYKAFESFINMEDSLHHTNPGNHHGIERTTFGSR